jgi:hypothetical protein
VWVAGGGNVLERGRCSFRRRRQRWPDRKGQVLATSMGTFDSGGDLPIVVADILGCAHRLLGQRRSGAVVCGKDGGRSGSRNDRAAALGGDRRAACFCRSCRDTAQAHRTDRRLGLGGTGVRSDVLDDHSPFASPRANSRGSPLSLCERVILPHCRGCTYTPPLEDLAGITIPAAPYFSAVGRFQSTPADSPAEIAREPEFARQRADQILAMAFDVRLKRAPQVPESVRARGCTDVSSDNPGVAIVVPRSGVLIRLTAPGTVRASLRQFAHSFPVDLGSCGDRVGWCGQTVARLASSHGCCEWKRAGDWRQSVDWVLTRLERRRPIALPRDDLCNRSAEAAPSRRSTHRRLCAPPANGRSRR